MKTISVAAFQGDIAIRKVSKLPTGAKKEKKQKEYIVAHSETGHHHVAVGASDYYVLNDMVSYLVTKKDFVIEHRREWDTHESQKFLTDGAETVFEIRRQREKTPEGWRRVED